MASLSPDPTAHTNRVRSDNVSGKMIGQLTAGLSASDGNFATELIGRLLPMAFDAGASDVHMQPTTQGWRILIRVDGVLTTLGSIQRMGDSDPVARLMVLAGLPTYRAGQPMEGRLRQDNAAAQSGSDLESTSPAGDEDAVSMRLGIFPTIHGPRAVIRLLRKATAFQSIGELGFAPDVASQVDRLCGEADGAILLTGPAGSGKTTTMCTMLRRIASQTPKRSVLTIEDPVEIIVDGISQSEIDVQSGMTLSAAVRSAVRQDSEVLLISEIRDPETVEAAMQASLTGHLIFSSLHATDVAATLRRLVAYDVPVHVIRSGIRAIINQRLVRKLCTICSGKGCAECLHSGYKMRQAIAQCVCFDGSDPVGDAMITALQAGHPSPVLRSAANEAGGSSLSHQAERLVRDGLTDQDEIYRVLGSSS